MSLNTFVLDLSDSENIPEGIIVKSRCANSSTPNLIILEIPDSTDARDFEKALIILQEVVAKQAEENAEQGAKVDKLIDQANSYKDILVAAKARIEQLEGQFNSKEAAKAKKGKN
jgi:uncharacterized protein YktA (UPF0223 family)